MTGSTGYEMARSDQDFTVIPEWDVQTWFARYKDKNNKSGLLLKHYQRADGGTEVTLSDINYYSGTDDWATLSIGHNSDGTRYAKAFYDPAETINGYELVTAKWLRSYIWNADQSQLVHTVNAEKINGAKTFTSSLISASSTFIKSVPWEGVSIADTSREKTANRTICEVIDKDGLRFMGLESTASAEGSRTFQVTARRRDNAGWINFLQIAEDNAGNAYFKVSQSPVIEPVTVNSRPNVFFPLMVSSPVLCANASFAHLAVIRVWSFTEADGLSAAMIRTSSFAYSLIVKNKRHEVFARFRPLKRRSRLPSWLK